MDKKFNRHAQAETPGEAPKEETLDHKARTVTISANGTNRFVRGVMSGKAPATDFDLD